MKIINPYALTHLPCSFCQMPTNRIGPLEGSVTYERFSPNGSTVVIKSRLCGNCYEIRGDK